MRVLSPLEARVLGVLVEKAHTVPDSYPLSLNSLTSGCNQKTAREPVINASDSDIQEAVDSLKGLSLAFESSGSRVSRYEHNMGRVLGIPSQSVALLAALMLRGPQTSAELRTNCERLHRFADVSSVDGFLVELAERSPEKGGPLAIKLNRAPGSREARWAHLMCGAVDLGPVSSGPEPEEQIASGELAFLRTQQRAMQAEIDGLRALVERLYSELGISR